MCLCVLTGLCVNGVRYLRPPLCTRDIGVLKKRVALPFFLFLHICIVFFFFFAHKGYFKHLARWAASTVFFFLIKARDQRNFLASFYLVECALCFVHISGMRCVSRNLSVWGFGCCRLLELLFSQKLCIDILNPREMLRGLLGFAREGIWGHGRGKPARISLFNAPFFFLCVSVLKKVLCI